MSDGGVNQDHARASLRDDWGVQWFQVPPRTTEVGVEWKVNWAGSRVPVDR